MAEPVQNRTELSPSNPMSVPEWRIQVGVTEEQLAAAKRASDYWAAMTQTLQAPPQASRLN